MIFWTSNKSTNFQYFSFKENIGIFFVKKTWLILLSLGKISTTLSSVDRRWTCTFASALFYTFDQCSTKYNTSISNICIFFHIFYKSKRLNLQIINWYSKQIQCVYFMKYPTFKKDIFFYFIFFYTYFNLFWSRLTYIIAK